ncbi:MAG: ATP-dependent RecD-like DNA helicase [Hyphomicrobiales bacterium]
METNLSFSTEAEEVIDLVKSTNKNLFITGKAGTGKSTLLDYLRKLPDNKIIVLAPTGISAININGETIHSFFKLKPGYELIEAAHLKHSQRMVQKLKALKTIMIDEISMVRADILDAIDIVLRNARKSFEPFGGVRMIFFGDLYQLPPVVTNDDEVFIKHKYESPYFFASNVFTPRDLFTPPFDIKTIELKTIYRQKETILIDLLNTIREGEVSAKDLEVINNRVNPQFTPDNNQQWVYLMTTNYQVNSINNKKLQLIDSDIIEFKAQKRGKPGYTLPNEEIIHVKAGAQVMFITNDSKKRWVNGTIGKVLGEAIVYDPESEDYVDGLEVQTNDGKVVKVPPFTWEISKYIFKNGKFTREIAGYYTQIPIKLAWAITIHKSQGKTFDNIIVDLGNGSFSHGQTYVALSRATSLNGIILKRPIYTDDIIVDPTINDYFLQKES